MKIIISHDVDHMTVWEHSKDLIIPKHIFRNFIELYKRKISFEELFWRFGLLFTNKWQRINEVMDYNDSLGIKSNFFFGVNNGVGLSYSLKHVKKWVPIVLSRDFEAGVHGIDYDSLESIKKEYDIFKECTTESEYGIRMHYLRKNDETINNLSRTGYLFDATEVGYKNPYKVNGMWEFPLQIMEGWEINQGTRYQNVDLEGAKESTLKKIEKINQSNLEYVSILFHDRYFHKSFKTWMDWYKWILNYLKEEGHEFITYKKAILELENKY